MPEDQFDSASHEIALMAVSRGVSRELFQRIFVAARAEIEKQGLDIPDALIVESITNELIGTMTDKAREILVNTADKKPGFFTRLFGMKGQHHD
jgi:hypothetical protein